MKLTKRPIFLFVLFSSFIIIFYTECLIWQRYFAENLCNKARKIIIPEVLNEKLRYYKQALTQLNKAIELNPLNSRYYFELAQVFSKIAKDKELARLLELLRVPPYDNQDGLNYKGILYLAQNNYLSAITLEPTNASYRLGLALNYISLGNTQGAEEEFSKAARLDSADASVHQDLANYYISLFDRPKLDLAYQEYRKAMLLLPQKQRVQVLEEVYANLTQDYQGLLGLVPPTAEGKCALAIFLKGKNRYDEAMGAFKQALALAKEGGAKDIEADIHNWIGIMRLERGELDEALKSFKKAREIMPNNGWSLRNIGWTYLQKGELQKAKKAYEESIELEPTEGWAYYGLGMISDRLNLSQEAIAYFRKALRLGLNDPQSEDFLLEKIELLSR